MRRIAVALTAIAIWAVVPAAGADVVPAPACEDGQTTVWTADFPKSKAADDNGDGLACQYERSTGSSKQTHYAYTDNVGDPGVIPVG